MSRKKLRDLSIVTFVGLFLLSKEPVFLWFLAAAMVLLASEDENKSNKKSSIYRRIKRDARKHKVQFPSDRLLKQSLAKVYKRFDESVENYPHLREDYLEIIDELWLSLQGLKTKDDWHLTIQSVLSQWPGSGKQIRPRVEEKINNVKRLTRQWEEARHEAFGGQNV